MLPGFAFIFPWDILILLAFGLSLWASYRVRSTFNRWSQVRAMSGMTGYDAARRMLDANGLYDVPVEAVPGTLSDHYDPLQRVVRLSEPVYYESTISAISVACHEVGHAIQHKVHYPMLVARHRIFPLVNLSSGAAPFLLIAGLLMHLSGLILLGIILFSVAVLFQVITLPVEFNATNRAKQLMVANGYVYQEEREGVNRVLNAAALTYVAAALMSLLQLLKFISIFNNSRD
jgi:Zn-dependent membrane protease YugP